MLVCATLLLSHGPIKAWADNSASTEEQGAASSPAKNADWDPVTKLLAWIQQNEGQVSFIGPPNACSSYACVCTLLAPNVLLLKHT